MNNNPILALMENDTPDKFAEDVANAFFANPAHVRKLLNADCIESCVDYVLSNQRVEFDLSDLALFEGEEPFFTKPSRQKGRRKHNKKEVRRKGSAKRFRDRNHKAAHEEHLYKVYDRGLAGDWNRRGRRLAEAGVVSTTNSHKIVRKIVPTITVDDQDETRIIKYEDGSSISCTMNKEAWIAPIWDKTKASYTSISKEWGTAEFEKMLNPNPPKQNTCWEADYDFDDCDPWEDDFEMGTDEFTAQELADFMQKLASATPEQRAMVRRFFSKNL